MDWFRWWHGTVTDPKFQSVARKTGYPVGSVIAVWAALLECASDATRCNADATRGNVASFHCNDFDVLLGFEDGTVQSIFDAMTDRGLIVDGEISKWNERQPKREDSGNPNTGALSSTERSRNRRAKQKENATASTEVHRDATQCNDMQRNATTEERREEEKRVNTSTTTNVVVVDSDPAPDLTLVHSNENPPKPAKADCPHQQIIALYHELLPMCPAIRDWTPARAQALRARWNEDAKRQSLDYWKRFFTYVAESEFLTGRAHTTQGRKPFFASLEWIVKAENFTKIREGKYHEGEAA